ncbi:hypothetical protein RRG08_037396 [Elysia crispata]|uniref:Uncharacterized protein n=1 Tax=Elysia crispata TaxID=231223 RepID=A0AAE1DXQ5_9GAST|nr:hypothetical protein RRG08_037396 [Elysia crispata]
MASPGIVAQPQTGGRTNASGEESLVVRGGGGQEDREDEACHSGLQVYRPERKKGELRMRLRGEKTLVGGGLETGGRGRRGKIRGREDEVVPAGIIPAGQRAGRGLAPLWGYPQDSPSAFSLFPRNPLF